MLKSIYEYLLFNYIIITNKNRYLKKIHINAYYNTSYLLKTKIKTKTYKRLNKKEFI